LAQSGHCRRAKRCALLGVKRHSLAALTKMPNPLGAEEEAEQFSQNRRATSIKSLPAPTSAANRTRSDISRSDDDSRLRRLCHRAAALKEKPRQTTPPGLQIFTS